MLSLFSFNIYNVNFINFGVKYMFVEILKIYTFHYDINREG